MNPTTALLTPLARVCFTFIITAVLLSSMASAQGSSSEVPGFIPRAWNIIGEDARGRFLGLVRYNQQAGFLVGTNPNPALAARNPRREKVDLNFGYRWRRSCEFFFAVDNITERPSYQVLGFGDRRYSSAVWAGSRRFNFGVQGKF